MTRLRGILAVLALAGAVAGCAEQPRGPEDGTGEGARVTVSGDARVGVVRVF